MRKVLMGVAGFSLLGLAACMQDPVVDIPDDARAEELPFAGEWNCDGARTTIGGMVYQGSATEKPVDIESAAARENGTFLLKLADGREIEVGNLTDSKMSITEHAKQSMFYCKRIN